MILDVCSTPALQGRLTLPPSKSYSIRALVIAACGGNSTLVNCSSCDDAKRALSAARRLGAKVSLLPQRDAIDIKGHLNRDARLLKISVGESGTVLRFLLPLLALRQGSSIVQGQGTLTSRPNAFLIDVLRKMGRKVAGQGPTGTVPIYVDQGHLKPGKIYIQGTLSSQFISALFIACPLLDGATSLRITGKDIVSKTYIDMTLAVLRQSGISIESASSRCYHIPGGQRYQGLGLFHVPSDYGLAAYFLAAGILTQSELALQGHFDDRLVQADGHILELLKRLGAHVAKTKNCLKISGPYDLKGGVFSLKHCPDLVPIMAVLALFAKTRTRLCHIAHARAKESDRISDLRKELVKIGACIQEEHDALIIHPQASYSQNVLLNPHHDHRLAMAFCVLGLKIGTKVQDIECIRKSYPGFVAALKKVGGMLKKR